MIRSDDIGERGQWLFGLLVTKFGSRRDGPYFRPHYLGDKYPTFDYLVELDGCDHHYCFVQVKTTRSGYRQSRNERFLRVKVSKEDCRRMAASPIPAYVVGIDEPGELGYILSMNEVRSKGLGDLPIRHVVTEDTLAQLWTEVRDFWVSRSAKKIRSHFV